MATTLISSGNRDYLRQDLIPLLRQGLKELLREVQKDRLQVASGLSWDEDGHLPQGWKPFNPLRWLGNWLKEHNENQKKDEGEYMDTRRIALTGVFQHLDTGRSYLEANSLIPVVGRYELAKDLQKARSLLDFFDLDGDGKVNEGDFVESMILLTMGSTDEEFQEVTKELLRTDHFSKCSTREEKLEFLFRDIDKDESRTLTMNELVTLAKRIDPDGPREHIHNTLKFLDEDSSGMVEQKEFVETLLNMFQGTDDEDSFDQKVCMMLQATPPGSPRLPEGSSNPKYWHLVSSIPTNQEAAQLSSATLIQQIHEDPDMLILIDVRSEEERDISTIIDAVTVDVVEDSEQPHGVKVDDKDVKELTSLYEELEEADDASMEDGQDSQLVTVTFCNTGLRGGAVALYLAKVLGCKVHNLHGGLIHYFNSGGELVNPDGETTNRLHPGSKQLAGYISRKNLMNISEITVDYGHPTA